jgi:hypothetical protein
MLPPLGFAPPHTEPFWTLGWALYAVAFADIAVWRLALVWSRRRGRQVPRWLDRATLAVGVVTAVAAPAALIAA